MGLFGDGRRDGGAGFSAAAPEKKAEKENSFLNGPPLTLQQVMEAAPVIYEAQMIKALENRGVSFYPGPAELQKLKAAKATDAEIALIQEKGEKFKPVAAPPKPLTAGPLTLTCAPAECMIEINGKTEGQTQGGVKRIASVPLGLTSSVFVDFKKDGYIGQQAMVQLKANTAAAKSVTLAPTEATQTKAGGLLLAAALAKLGGDKGLKDAGEMIATGRASVFLSGGERTEWSVVARLKEPAAMASLDLEGGGTKWWVSLKGSDTKSGGSGKVRGTPLAFETEKLVPEYRDFQPVTLLHLFVTGKYLTLSETAAADPAAIATLKASNATDSYTLTMAPNGLPQKVVFESASGLGSGLQVLYADYTAVGAAKVPKAMDIGITGHGEHGVKFRFDSVKASPGLKDKEFHR